LNTTETNRRIAEQFHEAFNRGDLNADCSDRPARADVLLREEPDEEEDEEDDEGSVTDDDGDDNEEDDGGYSVRVYPLCQW